MSYTHGSCTALNQDCRMDVLKLPNMYEQASLEPLGLHGSEHYDAKGCDTICEIVGTFSLTSSL